MAKKKTLEVKEEIPKQKIRLKLKAYDSRVIDNSAKQIIEVITRYGGKFLGPVPLPTEIHKYTVNRSSFVHKDSREQFEIRVHKRFIDIFDINPNLLEALRTLNLPAGVEIEIKM